jgi:aspartyl-tRNA(Asn)/glutamyl-tRNA(Gln) amidotransferase subunit B
VADILAGKRRAMGFLVGQVMKKTRGQANAAKVQELLAKRLDHVAGG